MKTASYAETYNFWGLGLVRDSALRRLTPLANGVKLMVHSNLPLMDALESLPEPPRFIAHEELSGSRARRRLFEEAPEPGPEGKLSPAEESLMFKRMNFSALRLNRIWKQRRELTADERSQYIEWYTRYFQLRERIVGANLGLVFKLLSKNRFTNVDFDDLRSEGLMALLRATDTFNPWVGFRFSTYACNAIIRAFARASELQSKRQHLWSNPYDPKLEPSNWGDFQRSEEVGLIAERVGVALRDQRSGLSEHERFVLKERFGHPTGDRATLKTVGKMMNISKERVRQIQASALAKLRRFLASDPVLQ